MLAENGVGGAAERYAEYAGMTAPEGCQLNEIVVAILHGAAQARNLIIREGGATAVVDGQHLVFGEPAEDGDARFVTREHGFRGAVPYYAHPLGRVGSGN